MGKFNIVLWILIAVILLLWFFVGPVRSQSARVVELPELAACSCDSAYRCMTDEEYMTLVGWSEENKHLWTIECEACQ